MPQNKLRVKGVTTGGGTTTTTTTLSPIITDVSYTVTSGGRRGTVYNIYNFTPTLINETLLNIADILGTRGDAFNTYGVILDPWAIRMYLVDDAGNIASNYFPNGTAINSYMTNGGYYSPSGSQDLYADSRQDTGNLRVAIGYRIITSTDPVTTIDTYENFIIDIYPTVFNIV